MKAPIKYIPFADCFTKDSNTQSESKLVFVGLPDDSQSTFRRGSCHAPERIRQAYDGNCYNSATESGVELADTVCDLGDLPAKGTWDSTARSYREYAASLFRDGKVPFFVGGDHAVTVPVVEALAVLNQPVHVVQFDAHPDLYSEFDGSLTSHACTAARMLEMEHVLSLTQVGIRTMNKVQAKQAKIHENRLTVITANKFFQEWCNLAILHKKAPVYVTLDMDVFDPAFAPGISHPVPGGLTSRQVLNFIQNASWDLVGMDVVEVNPEVDVNDQTTILAARLLHEAMGMVYKPLNPDSEINNKL